MSEHHDRDWHRVLEMGSKKWGNDHQMLAWMLHDLLDLQMPPSSQHSSETNRDMSASPLRRAGAPFGSGVRAKIRLRIGVRVKVEVRFRVRARVSIRV
jgi:hypothetical protein